MKRKVNRSKIEQTKKRNDKWRVGEKIKVSPHKLIYEKPSSGQLLKHNVSNSATGQSLFEALMDADLGKCD